MRRHLPLSVFVAVLLGIGVTADAGQAVSIPFTLGVSASPSELASGATTRVRVQVKNYRGDAEAVPEDLVYTLNSPISGDNSVRVKAGESAALAEVTFVQPGVATLVASATGLVSGTTPVVVLGAPQVASLPAAVIGAHPRPALRGDASDVAPPPAPPAPKLNLALAVVPEHVHPANASWRAIVLVTAVDANEQPIGVSADTPIHLATDVGEVMPTAATIARGHARTTEAIQVTSTKPGHATVWAWDDSGAFTRATFNDDDATPAQLSVKAVPARTLNDGRTAIHVSVFLQDDTATATKAAVDTAIKLTSSIGTVTPSVVSIAKGQFVGEATLTSATAGGAEITATAAGMRPGTASVAFVFPTMLVIVAGLGGLIGSLVRSTDLSFTGAWWHHLGGSVVIGAVLGLLFYLLAMFGIIASIPKLAIPLGQLPTTNELAALVLGFFGGYYARAWLPNPAEPSATDKGKPAQQTA
jgi:hypothetical protein